MTISILLPVAARAIHWNRTGRIGLSIVAWMVGSCVTAELLGYWLHRLMHSGAIRFFSDNHMKHHLIFYGPLQRQRLETYRDATDRRAALGNIGLEWLIPAGLLISIVMMVFHLFRVSLIYQVLSLATTVTWSFLMFSYLHDVMHIEGFWLAKNKLLKHWFLSARRLHDIHHRVLNDSGLMDKNFGIGFFAFDRLFGTLTLQQPRFNRRGYDVAREKFKYLEYQAHGHDDALASTAAPTVRVRGDQQQTRTDSMIIRTTNCFRFVPGERKTISKSDQRSSDDEPKKYRLV